MIHDHGTALRCGHDGGYECAQAGKYDVGFLLKWAPKLYTCFCLLNYISPSCAAVVRCISKSKNSRRKCTDSMRLSNQPCPFHTIYCLPLMIKPCVAKLCCSVRLAYAIYCYRSAETPSTVKRVQWGPTTTNEGQFLTLRPLFEIRPECENTSTTGVTGIIWTKSKPNAHQFMQPWTADGVQRTRMWSWLSKTDLMVWWGIVRLCVL